MLYSDVKALYNQYGSGTIQKILDVIGREYTEDLLIELESTNPVDFEVGNFRIIDYDYIDGIQCEELESDPYVLGCFTSWFLASILGVDAEVIEAAQKGNAYYALGESIINGGHIGELQEEYVSSDGYGHHFAHYDHNEHSCGQFAVFRIY